MIRTRDFMLYCLTVIFLVMAIGATYTVQHKSDQDYTQPMVALVSGEEATGVAAPGVSDSRLATIAQLKAKLAAGEGTLISSPPVFTSVDSGSATNAPPDVSEATGATAPCAVSNAALKTNWPSADISVTVVEGARVFSYDQLQTFTVGTTTIQATSTKTLAALPVVPLPSGTVACANDIIGLSLTGQLIFNDSTQYQTAAATTLLGYALDGFPIYGVLSNPVSGDSCGGVMSSAGYRYHISSDQSEVLKCFRGVAQPITL